jgi:hypothetical protein
VTASLFTRVVLTGGGWVTVRSTARVNSDAVNNHASKNQRFNKDLNSTSK